MSKMIISIFFLFSVRDIEIIIFTDKIVENQKNIKIIFLFIVFVSIQYVI